MAVKIIIKDTEKSFLMPNDFEEQNVNLKELVDNTFSKEELFGITENPFEDPIDIDSINTESTEEAVPTDTTGDTPPQAVVTDETLEEVRPSVSDEKAFDTIIEKVVDEEGSYVNDPKDPGGPTKYGIALNLNKKALRKIGITNADGMKTLTYDQAKQIYRDTYWDKSKVELLPKEVQFDYFTAYINSPKRAIKAMQKAVGTKADGVIGPKTIQAIKDSYSSDKDLGKRIKYEYVKSLIESSKGWNSFGNGWANRYLETKEFGKKKIDIASMDKAEALDTISEYEPGIQIATKSTELPPGVTRMEEGMEFTVNTETEMPPGDYQRDDGTFFTVTMKGEVIDYGA